MSDNKFIRCNELFKGVQVQGKKAGKGTVKHKDEIESEDLERLQDYFSRYMEPNAEVLQQYVMFNVIYYLCRRGRQNIPQLRVDMFEVCIFLSQLKTFSLTLNQKPEAKFSKLCIIADQIRRRWHYVCGTGDE